VGVADPLIAPGADAEPGLGGGGEALHLAAVDSDLATAVFREVRLSLAGPGAQRRLNGSPRGVRYRRSVAPRHSSAPPTVIVPTRTWPWPVPTGTFCPPLPQIPVFIKKSSPTASIAASASKQLPTRVAPRQGRVTSPASIK